MEKNIFSKILGIENIILHNVFNEIDKIIFEIELERKPHKCPFCNNLVREVYQIKKQLIKDIPAFDKETYLLLRKHRYICRRCNHSFLEDNKFIAKHQRKTKRMIKKIFEMTSEVSSFTSISKQLKISLSTIIRTFDKISYPTSNFQNTEVVSIDEFKGNTGGEKYNCIIADPKRKIVLDILPKRYKNDLEIYFYKVNKKTRDNVKIFISDMWRTYFDVAKDKFKKSKFVVDKYHWIRQVIWAFENVRKEEQKRFSKEYRKYFKRSKSLLTKRFKFLSDEQKQEVNIMLYYSENLRIAHDLKEEFFEILECKNRLDAKKKLSEWILYAQNCKLKSFEKCGETFINWSTGILNSFDTKYTNGFIEGCNNKIKVLKRNGYGFKNFKRFRNRILHIFNYNKEIVNY